MGMQEWPLQIFQHGIQPCRKTTDAVSTINRIADHRVSLLRHMNANLVCSSGFDVNAQKRHGTEILLNGIMRDRGTAFSRARGNLFPVFWISPQGQADRAGRG